MTRQYYCPKDPEEVLFEEEEGRMELIIFKAPKRCPKCGEYYYKEQLQLSSLLPGAKDDEP